MSMKKIIICILSFLLLCNPLLKAVDCSDGSLSETLSYYWNNVKNDPIPYLFVGGLAAIATYLLYKEYKDYQSGLLSLSYESDESEFENSLSLQDTIMVGNSRCIGGEREFNNVTIKQLKVARQTDGASCGYHARKNADFIAHCLSENEATLGELVTNRTRAEILFGKNGTWRKPVIEERKKTVLKNYINNRLKRLIKKPTKDDGSIYKLEKIENVYKTCIDDLAQNCAIALVNKSELSITIKPDNFYDLITTCMKNKMENLGPTWRDDYFVSSHIEEVTQEQLKNYALSTETISSFIQPLEKPLTITLDNIKAALVEYNRNNGNEIDLQGDWLNNGEIESLGSEAEEKRDHLRVIENVNEFDPKKFKDKSMQEGYIHRFILGTMKRYGNVGSRGHWISCVLYNNGGKREYIIADSLMSNQLNSDLIEKFICKIERSNNVTEETD